MKKLVIFFMVVLGVVFTTTLKAQNVDSTEVEESIIDPLFNENPHLYSNVYSDPWAKTRLLQQDYETFNRVWNYHRKQTKEMCIGLGLGAIGVAGMVYTVNMPTPTRQVNNPALDPAADEARRNRRIVGASSILIGTAGAIIFTRSFRWTRRMKAEIGLQSLRLQYNLTGKRSYFKKNRKHPKKLKTLQYGWQ